MVNGQEGEEQAEGQEEVLLLRGLTVILEVKTRILHLDPGRSAPRIEEDAADDLSNFYRIFRLRVLDFRDFVL